MAKRKFGRYTIDFKKIGVEECGDGIVKVTARLSGDIEIGIDIDSTWRGDWLAKQLFKDASSDYYLRDVDNNYTQYSPEEVNIVTATFKRRNNLFSR